MSATLHGHSGLCHLVVTQLVTQFDDAPCSANLAAAYESVGRMDEADLRKYARQQR